MEKDGQTIIMITIVMKMMMIAIMVTLIITKNAEITEIIIRYNVQISVRT